VKKRNSSSGGAALHLGSEYQVRVAAWLAVEMLAERRGRPFSPRGRIVILRGETQESMDDLLVGTANNQYGFIQAKRRISFSEKLDSEFVSVIDQAVRQFTAANPTSGPRPWSREMSPATDRLLLVTSSLSGGTINVVLREVLIRVRSLATGQPLNDAAVTEAEAKKLKATISLIRSSWELATTERPSDTQVHSLLSLMSVEVLDVEEGGQGEREAIRTLSSMVIDDANQEGAAWSSVLKACRKMVTGRSGLNLEALREQLRSDGIILKVAEPSRQDIERNEAQTGQIDKLIDEARDALNQHDHPRAKLLLERIERDHDSQLNKIQKFRVATNQGFTALGLGKPEQAAKRFLEALSIQPEHEKARTNEVLAYYVVGDSPTAFGRAEQIRPLYPSSVHLAHHWILASPPEITAQDLERKLSSILLADSQIQFALACKALSQQDLGAAEIYADKAMSFDPAKTQPRVVATQICLAKIMRLEAGFGSASDSRPELIKSAERNAREAIRLAEIEKDTRSQLEARTLLVDILLLLDRKKKALDEADRAVQLNPNSIQALMARSQAQFENDMIGEGISRS
jgi:tetratricopeptide (TPR) repeat protein